MKNLLLHVACAFIAVLIMLGVAGVVDSTTTINSLGLKPKSPAPASSACETPKVVVSIPVGLKREEYAAICKAQGGEPDKYFNERDDYDRAWATCYRPNRENGILVWTFRVEGWVDKRPRDDE